MLSDDLEECGENGKRGSNLGVRIDDEVLGVTDRRRIGL